MNIAGYLSQDYDFLLPKIIFEYLNLPVGFVGSDI
jgi:hypothetical protein